MPTSIVFVFVVERCDDCGITFVGSRTDLIEVTAHDVGTAYNALRKNSGCHCRDCKHGGTKCNVFIANTRSAREMAK